MRLVNHLVRLTVQGAPPSIFRSGAPSTVDRRSPVGPSASSLARSRGSDDSAVVAEQLNIGVVTISGEAAMAHMENSVIDSQRVIEPSWPLACAACGPLPVSCPQSSPVNH